MSASALLTPAVVHAQTFADISQDHWAYQAVQDLADKGLVKGYPNGKFLGNRALTRYELATVIQRLLQTVSDLNKTTPAPTSPEVTQDDLNKIQALVDDFHKELSNQETDLAAAQKQISSLREQTALLKRSVTKAQSTADDSYGFGANRKFAITGYIQARYFGASSDEQTDPTKLHYPHGIPSTVAPYNGTYASGANGASFGLRRARIRFLGQVSQNTRYGIQLDTIGYGPTPVGVREGNITYTAGNGDYSKNLAFSAGIIGNPFGYMLSTVPAIGLTPERPLAFNESPYGLFNGQDFDRGVSATLPSRNMRYTIAILNGAGFASNDTDRVLNQVYRAAYTGGAKFSAGVSFYNGQLPYTGTPGVNYAGRKKQLTGFDVQVAPTKNLKFLGEYVGGKFEQRSYFTGATQPSLAFTTTAAPGNKIEGYYIQGGYTCSPQGAHPLTFAVSYDKFARSKSGVNAAVAGGGSGSSFDDINLGYGVLYGLDRQTQLRLWYTDPTRVAHAANAVDPQKVGLFTSEIQVRF